MAMKHISEKVLFNNFSTIMCVLTSFMFSGIRFPFAVFTCIAIFDITQLAKFKIVSSTWNFL